MKKELLEVLKAAQSIVDVMEGAGVIGSYLVIPMDRLNWLAEAVRAASDAGAQP